MTKEEKIRVFNIGDRVKTVLRGEEIIFIIEKLYKDEAGSEHASGVFDKIEVSIPVELLMMVESRWPGGRPTKYKGKETIDKVKEYIDSCFDIRYKLLKSEGKTTSYENKINVKIPSIEGLALYLGVTKDLIYDWMKKHPRFLDAIKELKQRQCERLMDKGLDGTYNPMITKLLLGTHGYVEKKEVDTNQPPAILNVNLEKKIEDGYAARGKQQSSGQDDQSGN